MNSDVNDNAMFVSRRTPALTPNKLNIRRDEYIVMRHFCEESK